MAAGPSDVPTAPLATAQNPAVTVTVDAGAGRKPISPLIYGVNLATAAALSDLNIPLNRLGGNNTSRYNWRLNAENKGADWYYESLAEPSAVTGDVGDTFLTLSKAAGAQPMLTIPILGWVAKLGPNRGKLASFSISKYGPQSDRDSQWFPDAGNGIRTSGAEITGNDPNDANIPADSVFQQDWVRQIVAKWGPAASGGLKYYVLDNEPSIWHSTHRDVHPEGAHAIEIRDKVLEYAARIKAVDPGARIVGPEEWGWSGYMFSGYDQQYGDQHGWSRLPDRDQVMGGMDYLPWLLAQWKSAGTRPLDVVSAHYYPQGNEYSNDVSTKTQLLRNRSTRSLWDPKYVDESWISDVVRLIPRLKEWVGNYYYADTPVAITEYNWGAEGHINGATTQADILGIFGREGLDLAARWTTPDPATPTYKAIKMYRNYDGNRSAFGDTSVSTTAPNPDELSAFAAVRSKDNALTVMLIDKALSGATPVTLNIANFGGAGIAEVYQLTSSNTISRLADLKLTGAILTLSLPSQSVTLLVLPDALTKLSNHPPTAALSADVVSGAAPLAVHFSATGSFDTDGFLTAYSWQFGDGSVADGLTAAHTYVVAGTYAATLTVTDDQGAKAAASQVITVTAPSPAATCSVKYTVTNDWKSGFLADVKITNSGAAIRGGWKLTWTFAGNEAVTDLWNGIVSQTGKSVAVQNESWNANVAAGATVDIGFVADYSGATSRPATFLLNGNACTGN
jgi:PKD repeat protein